MRGSTTTPGRLSTRDDALRRIVFRYTDSVDTRNMFSIAAQWLAYTFPYRRFADTLANACARLGANAVRYTFIAVDFHHLFLAGLPAHLCENYLRFLKVGMPCSNLDNFASLIPYLSI
jgi:hypothetical protein